jgi:predicted nicotinamide N-methyase
MLSYITELFEFNQKQFVLAIPEQDALKNWYEQNKTVHTFPFWAKVWPAAKALSQFIVQHREIVTDKTVVEIAGGLGLPSLVTSSFAKKVICTDAIPEVLYFLNTSFQLNSITNIKAEVYNWNEELKAFDADVLLLSDVNYDPSHFSQLLSFIELQLKKGITILLSTPQRLMAKPFVEALAPLIKERQELHIEEEKTLCSVFVLKGN